MKNGERKHPWENLSASREGVRSSHQAPGFFALRPLRPYAAFQLSEWLEEAAIFRNLLFCLH